VGQNLVQVARIFGAARVIAVDLHADKLELARRMGATDVVNAAEGDVVEQVRELTGGRGVDVAFEALGNPVTVDQAIRSVGDGGRAVIVGIAAAGVRAGFDITHVVRRKIQVLGSYGGRPRTDMPLVLELAAAGRLHLDDLVTRRFSLEDSALAYDELARGAILGRAVVDMSR
jgi:S-(hydroxymethyl)glutathione dehydrogenase/alcohol dehydrogenase